MSSDTRSRLDRWLTPEVVVTSLTLLVAVTLAYSAIKSDVRDLGTQIKQQNEVRQADQKQLDDWRKDLELKIGKTDDRSAERDARQETEITELKTGRDALRTQIGEVATKVTEIGTIVKRIDERVPGKP